MMRGLHHSIGNRSVGAAVMLFALLAGTCHAPAAEVRTLFVPFGGPSELGRSVATIFALQFWQTLRREPPRNPSRLNFGDGSVYWLGRNVPVESHQTAARLAAALDVTAQHVLWGQVHTFEGSALVTAYLTLPDYADFRPRRNEVWTLSLRADTQPLMVDIPQRAYAFEPIVLPAEFVKTYSSPSALAMRARKGTGPEVGRLGKRFDRIQSDGPYALVYSGGVRGWVYLPQIGQHQPEIIDFVAGIMRIYRQDWQGAIDLLTKVVRNQQAPTGLRLDSFLYLIRAKSELRLAADEEAREALALAPASRRAIQYVAMHYLGRGCLRTGAGCPPDATEFLANLPGKYGPLFADGDRWLVSLREAISQR